MMINYPILVIGFNRPLLLNNLLEHLSKIGVSKLYVSLDGPRDEQEALLCKQSYEVVKSYKHLFDLTILYRPYNLGCCLGVVSALDWFFNETDFGAVIEDDCLPKLEFFEFLSHVNENKHLLNIATMKLYTAHNPFDFNFSNQLANSVLIHGWATFSQVWTRIRKDYFQLKLPSIVNNVGLKRNLPQALFWWANSTRAKLGLVDTWDGIMNDQVWRLGFKTLIPKRNLVDNLGYGPLATHTKDTQESNQIRLPHDVLINNNLDFLLNTYYFKIRRKHIFTSIARAFFDYLKFFKRKKFEKLLKYDLSKRNIDLP